MKKLLYTTSALVGAAFLMESVAPAFAEVNISMRYRAALLSRSVDKDSKDKTLDVQIGDTRIPSGPNDADQRTTVEGDHFNNAGVYTGGGFVGTKARSTSLNSSKINIDLSASKDHPNGLTTGASLAIATSDKKLDYDNAIGYISGSFGKFEVGDFHDVGYRALGYGTPGTSNFGAVDAGFNPAGSVINTSATGNIGGRASSIAYWSPSFSGAQVGVSWSPQVSKEGKQVGFTSTQGDIEDSIGFTATYSGAFGGTGVSMGVSYETAKTVSRSGDKYAFGDLTLIQASGGAPTVANNERPNINLTRKNQDPTAFAGYVSFDIQNFTIGGSYGSWEKDAANSSVTTESTAYALGASYSIDALTFGLGWATQDDENKHHNIRTGLPTGTTTGAQVNGSGVQSSEEKTTILAFTAAYQLGDGASIDFVMERASEEATVRGVTVEDDASGFGVGIDLKF